MSATPPPQMRRQWRCERSIAGNAKRTWTCSLFLHRVLHHPLRSHFCAVDISLSVHRHTLGRARSRKVWPHTRLRIGNEVFERSVFRAADSDPAFPPVVVL